jgi:hypothetical protein
MVRNIGYKTKTMKHLRVLQHETPKQMLVLQHPNPRAAHTASTSVNCCDTSMHPLCCDCVKSLLRLWHCCIFSIQIPLLRVQHQPRTIAAFASQRDCIAARASIAAAASWPPFAAFAAPLTSGLHLLHL